MRCSIKTSKNLAVVSVFLLLSACGGGGSSSGSDGGDTNPPPEPVTKNFTISLSEAKLHRLSNDEEVIVDVSGVVSPELTFEP